VNTVALETLVRPISDAVPLLAQLLSEGGLEIIFRPGLSGVKLHATIGRAPQQLLVCFIYGRDAVPPGEQNLVAMAKALTAALEAEPTESQTEVTAMSQARGVQHCFPTGRDFVDEELTVSGRGVLRYRQPFGQFSNPNPYMGIATAEWLCECVQLGVNAGSNGVPCTDLLELYCGAGSHTMALAPRFRHVLAVDINRHLVQAANYNVSANGLTNVSVIRAPSEEFCRRVIRKRSYEIRRQDGSCELELHFGCTIVDPPRAGLDDLTRAAVSGYDHVLYISCNPEALRRDLQELLTTHEVCRLVLLDHFPYSSHAECGVHLRKRAS
jgi:tRNA (uracil-5-)-methyltransferase